MMIHGWSTSVESTINLEGWDEEYKTLWPIPESRHCFFCHWAVCSWIVPFWFEQAAYAQDVAGSAVDLAEEVRDMPVSSTIRLLFILTALTFVPAMILAMTPFTRFVIVFSMMRQAIGLQQSPPNQVLIGLSLFLSLMIMNKPLNKCTMRPSPRLCKVKWRFWMRRKQQWSR